MEMNENGTCKVCSDLDNPMFALPEKIRKAGEDVRDAANKVAAPATPIINVVLVGGITAGLLAGAVFAWTKLRKK